MTCAAYLPLSLTPTHVGDRLGLHHCARDCRVGGGALASAGLRPPRKLHVQFSRMQLSRKRDHQRPWTQGRNQRNQANQPQLATKTPRRESAPPRTAPPFVMVRPQASHHPPIELVEESPYVGAFVVLAPPANHRIEFADQLRSFERDAALRRSANAIFEPIDRLLSRVRVQTAASRFR